VALLVYLGIRAGQSGDGSSDAPGKSWRCLLEFPAIMASTLPEVRRAFFKQTKVVHSSSKPKEL
jgi:hypothetical protein